MKYLLNSWLFLALFGVDLVYGPSCEFPKSCAYESKSELDNVIQTESFIRVHVLEVDPTDTQGNARQNEFNLLCALPGNLFKRKYCKLSLFYNGDAIEYKRREDSDQEIVIKYFQMLTEVCVLFNLEQESFIYYMQKENDKSLLSAIQAKLEVILNIPRFNLPDQTLCFRNCVKVYNPSAELHYLFFCVWDNLPFQMLIKASDIHLTRDSCTQILEESAFRQCPDYKQFGLGCSAKAVKPEEKIISEENISDKNICVHFVFAQQNFVIRRPVRPGQNLLEIGNGIYKQIMSVILRANSSNWKQVFESQFPIDMHYNTYPIDTPQNALLNCTGKPRDALLNYLMSQEGYTLFYQDNKVQEWINGQFIIRYSQDNASINIQGQTDVVSLDAVNPYNLTRKLSPLPREVVCTKLLNALGTEPSLFADLVSSLRIWQIWEVMRTQFNTDFQSKITESQSSFEIRNVREFTICIQGNRIKIIAPERKLEFTIAPKSSRFSRRDFIEQLAANPDGIANLMQWRCKRESRTRIWIDILNQDFGFEPYYSFNSFDRVEFGPQIAAIQ